MINAEVLRRKANLGSDRAFVDNFDFLYSSQMVKKMFAFFFAVKMAQGSIGWLLVFVRWLAAIFCVIPIYFILVLIQLYLSMIVSFFRLFKVKNLFVDGSFFFVFIFFHNLLIFPYVLSGGESIWLNTYVLKLPTWLFNAVIYV